MNYLFIHIMMFIFCWFLITIYSTYANYWFLIIIFILNFTKCTYSLKIYKCWGFPGGLVVKNPLANAEDIYGFNAWSRKIPCAVGQLSPWAIATEPVCSNYWSPHTLEPHCNYSAHILQLLKPARPRAHALWQKKPPQREAHTLEKSVAVTRCN